MVMAKEMGADIYINSVERDANKPADQAGETWVSNFADRLFEACCGYLRDQIDLPKKREIERRRLDEADRCIDQLFRALGALRKHQLHCHRTFSKDGGGEALSLLKYNIQRRKDVLREKTAKKGAGRPNVKPFAAKLIYAALRKADGNRDLIDKIGKVLAPGSSSNHLNQRIDKLFGKGAFDSLRLPVPDFDRRWESTSMKSLRRFAWNDIFKIQLFFNVELMTREEMVRHFEKTVAAIGKFAPPIKSTENDNWVADELNFVSNYRDGSDVETPILDKDNL